LAACWRGAALIPVLRHGRRFERELLVRVVEEREDKFKVARGWALPELARFVPPGGRVREAVQQLDSRYFDTADGALRSLGITLRRRKDDGEVGWQLKVPNGSARNELQSRSQSESIPRSLADALAGLRDDQELAPVADIATTRRAHRVEDESGGLLFELADDEVSATTPGQETTPHGWREVEVELGPAGTKKILKRVRQWLQKAGATLDTGGTKLDHALALAAAADPAAGRATVATSTELPGKPGTLGALVAGYLAEQCDVIAVNDIGLRTGAPLVHPTRVAVRRLRSTFRVFDDLISADASAALEPELVWYAELLGKVRDCDILEKRLVDRLTELPAEQVLGPVAGQIQRVLSVERKEASDRLAEGMASERYRNLLGSLRTWHTAPPLTAAAGAKPVKAAGYVRTARRKAEKRLANAGDDVEQFHRARKAMKRLRYAAEMSDQAVPKAGKIARRAKRLQTLLGDHQDAVVAAQFLARMGATAGVQPGHNGFTYGVLMATELDHAAGIRSKFAS
jgi:CHAD domain-containing protein